MAAKSITELDVWTEVIAAENADMAPDGARAVLRWQFNDAAKGHINKLADRNNEGALTDAEREEPEAYMHVGQIFAILHAKAR